MIKKIKKINKKDLEFAKLKKKFLWGCGKIIDSKEMLLLLKMVN